MKFVNKSWILIPGLVLSVASCTDLDTQPEGGNSTSDQKQEIAEAIPERLAADLSGMYFSIGKQYCVYGIDNPRDDDFGYPAACLSLDLNGADMVSDASGYNWFSVSSEYQDRAYTFANPRMRWAMIYNQIKMANDIIATISDENTDKVLNYYKAQAIATRAFDYLTLVQQYQFTYKGNETKPAVPIVIEKQEGDMLNNPRATVQAVYDLIMDDLNRAIPMLEGYNRKSKNEIDQQVAYGLRARANLVMQNWSAAYEDATKALAGYTPYSREEAGKPGFNDASAHSWMWALILTPTNMPDAYPSWPSVISSFSGDSYSAGVGCYKSINTLLYTKIPDTDIRKGWWVDENLDSPILEGLSWRGYDGQPIGPLVVPDVKMAFYPYTNVKFGGYQNILGNNINAGDWCMMRSEEMILIQAEARAMSGDVAGGKAILEDFVKTYRDPSYICKAAGPADFQNEVWLQRRIELWGEGFALFDILRLQKNIVRFNNRVKTNFPEGFRFNLAANDGWLLMRIPRNEINANNGISEADNNNEGTLPQSGNGAGLTDGVTD